MAAALSFTFTHSSMFFPSKSTTASDGGALHSAAGVTTLGSGFQISVSSGFGLGCAFCAYVGTVIRRRDAAKRSFRCRVSITTGVYTTAFRDPRSALHAEALVNHAHAHQRHQDLIVGRPRPRIHGVNAIQHLDDL